MVVGRPNVRLPRWIGPVLATLANFVSGCRSGLLELGALDATRGIDGDLPSADLATPACRPELPAAAATFGFETSSSSALGEHAILAQTFVATASGVATSLHVAWTITRRDISFVFQPVDPLNGAPIFGPGLANIGVFRPADPALPIDSLCLTLRGDPFLVRAGTRYALVAFSDDPSASGDAVVYLTKTAPALQGALLFTEDNIHWSPYKNGDSSLRFDLRVTP